MGKWMFGIGIVCLCMASGIVLTVYCGAQWLLVRLLAPFVAGILATLMTIPVFFFELIREGSFPEAASKARRLWLDLSGDALNAF